jgi:hypothetical protein
VLRAALNKAKRGSAVARNVGALVDALDALERKYNPQLVD